MNMFFKDLKKHIEKIITYEKKEMILLTAKESKSCHKQKVCYICKIGFGADDDKKNIIELKTIVIILEDTEELLTIFAI